MRSLGIPPSSCSGKGRNMNTMDPGMKMVTKGIKSMHYWGEMVKGLTGGGGSACIIINIFDVLLWFSFNLDSNSNYSYLNYTKS